MGAGNFLFSEISLSRCGECLHGNGTLSSGMLEPSDLKFAEQPYMMLLSGAVYDGVVGNNPENGHNILTANSVPHIWNPIPEGGHDNNSIQPHVYNLVRFAFKAE